MQPLTLRQRDLISLGTLRHRGQEITEDPLQNNKLSNYAEEEISDTRTPLTATLAPTTHCPYLRLADPGNLTAPT